MDSNTVKFILTFACGLLTTALGVVGFFLSRARQQRQDLEQDFKRRSESAQIDSDLKSDVNVIKNEVNNLSDKINRLADSVNRLDETHRKEISKVYDHVNKTRNSARGGANGATM